MDRRAGRHRVTPELKATYVDCWAIVSQFADVSATDSEKFANITRVVDAYGAAETAAALGFLAGSVLLSAVRRIDGHNPG